MGRRRRQVAKTFRRALPELYLCPRCGKNTVKSTIDKKKERASVVCSNCRLSSTFVVSTTMAEVDAYCNFVDRYYSGEPLEGFSFG